MSMFDRITHVPGVMGGKACIRGMRVTVGMVLGQVAEGRSVEEMLQDYPYLEREEYRTGDTLCRVARPGEPCWQSRLQMPGYGFYP